MRFNILFFLLAISCVSLALAHVSYDDCCLTYVTKVSRSIKKFAVDYRRQEADGGCNINAVIFTMRKGRVLCTNPKDGWVIQLVKKLDKKKVRDGQRTQLRPQPYRG